MNKKVLWIKHVYMHSTFITTTFNFANAFLNHLEFQSVETSPQRLFVISDLISAWLYTHSSIYRWSPGPVSTCRKSKNII